GMPKGAPPRKTSATSGRRFQDGDTTDTLPGKSAPRLLRTSLAECRPPPAPRPARASCPHQPPPSRSTPTSRLRPRLQPRKSYAHALPSSLRPSWLLRHRDRHKGRRPTARESRHVLPLGRQEHGSVVGQHVHHVSP